MPSSKKRWFEPSRVDLHSGRGALGRRPAWGHVEISRNCPHFPDARQLRSGIAPPRPAQRRPQASTLRGHLLPDATRATILFQNGVGRMDTTDSDFRKFSFLEGSHPLLQAAPLTGSPRSTRFAAGYSVLAGSFRRIARPSRVPSAFTVSRKSSPTKKCAGRVALPTSSTIR